MARNLAEIETIASRTVSLLLRKRIPVTQAHLFGSQVEGVPDENSDIDIATFSPAADAMDAATRVALVVDEVTKLNGRYIDSSDAHWCRNNHRYGDARTEQ